MSVMIVQASVTSMPLARTQRGHMNVTVTRVTSATENQGHVTVIMAADWLKFII